MAWATTLLVDPCAGAAGPSSTAMQMSERPFDSDHSRSSPGSRFSQSAVASAAIAPLRTIRLLRVFFYEHTYLLLSRDCLALFSTPACIPAEHRMLRQRVRRHTTSGSAMDRPVPFPVTSS